MFQSSPTLTGGCNLVPDVPLSGDGVFVSILTHPYGRMQPADNTQILAAGQGFNPHPPLRADATSGQHPDTGRRSGFQSSPTLTGGCNQCDYGWAGQGMQVSILTHPYGRMQPLAGVHLPLRRLVVSILTHPYGRMQLRCREYLQTRAPQFQSSPTLTGGCNRGLFPGSDPGRRVSILTHPYGRMQLDLHRARPIAVASFNPHPPLRADATRPSRPWRTPERSCFNPHPPLRADATMS